MVIYLIYLYEQKRNEVESEKYKWKIDELRELAKNIQNIELEFYEQQNLGDLQGYINGFWSISLVEEKNAHYFYNELLKINFHFNWPSFTFKQSVHDPSYKPTPLGSGVQSVAGSGRSGLASGQRSGQDSGHIKFEDEEEEEEGAKEDEEEEDSDDEEDDQPGPSTTAVQHGQEHGDEIIEEGQQPGWQVGYPPQWADYSYPLGQYFSGQPSQYDASQSHAPQWTGQYDDHGRPIYAYPGESSHHHTGQSSHDP